VPHTSCNIRSVGQYGNDNKPEHTSSDTTSGSIQMAKYMTKAQLPALFAALLLAGCSGMQSASDGTDLRTAQQMAERGDHAGASRVYLDLALEAKGEQRQRFVLFSASELYLAADLEGANRILGETGDPIAPANLELWALVTAELRLAEQNPQAALDALNEVTSTRDASAAKRILLLRSDALFMLERPQTAVATLMQRESLLRSGREIADNRRLIWAGLQTTGHRIPADVASREGDSILLGWLELGYISHANRASVASLVMSIEDWREANPEHPASGALLDEVLAGLETLLTYPDRVAMLLPLSGKQRSFGEAIRDGYMAAHFSLSEDLSRPDVRFYDTARSGVSTAYQQAIVGGADFIVGPLLKNDVGELASFSSEVPVLALNYGPEDTAYPGRFYQFALAPEDEARAAAARATEQGQFNAVALVPQSQWGERVLAAFQDELQNRGGQLLAARSYETETADFADVIRDVLLLNESYARRDRLAANIGKSLEFKPRRRQDVDLIFVAANSAMAKLLRPQLRFHYAADIPTYATSAIYKPGSTDNDDLNGIMFPDIPWLLKPTQIVVNDKAVLTDYWGAGADALARFYAMGYDAFHLSGQLESARRASSIEMAGMTGTLYMDDSGRLHRELTWAKMERGKPRTLPDMQRNPTEDVQIVIR
jgi:outer membrane PBP1 activator LpoA protein